MLLGGWHGLGLHLLGSCSLKREPACLLLNVLRRCWHFCGRCSSRAQRWVLVPLLCALARQSDSHSAVPALVSNGRWPYPMRCSFCGSLPSLHLSAELQGKPTVRKAMVVTPSSLCQNWADEARKWLGVERMRVMVLSPGPDGKQQARRGGGEAGQGVALSAVQPGCRAP
jgi:hypothetical protein